MVSRKKRVFLSFSTIYRRVLVIFLVICALIAVFSFQYYMRLSSTIREESEGYLQEVSRRIGSNIDRIVNDNYDVLYTMAVSLEYSGVERIEDVQNMLHKQKEFWNYENILLIDQEGTAYNLSSTETFLTLDQTVREGLLSGQETMSTTQIIKNQEYILFSVPLKNIAIGEKTMVALAGCYAPSSFNQVLSMSSFNEQAYSQIVTTSGTVVVRSFSPYAFKSGYNIFSTLQDAKLKEKRSLEKVAEDMTESRSGQISFEQEGKGTYMVYTPIAPEDWYLLTFVPVEVVNEKSNLLLQSTMLICGLITVIFAGLSAALVYIFNNHKRKLEHIAYVDEVTGGNSIQRFYELASELISPSDSGKYALVYTNIVKFKVLNEELGSANCDDILKLFGMHIAERLTARECMGRHSADHFCILVEFSGEQVLLDKFKQWHTEAERVVLEKQILWALPMMEFGIYVIENGSLPFPQMIDRAKLALREMSHTVDSKLRCAFYNDSIRRQLLREKQIEDKMEKALLDKEFKVFLQPKYHLPEEHIGGAEALVRWQSSGEGMIYPDEFIPLFEKNGFILQLDLFVFETVCRTLRKWIDQGLTPVKISVNCSRLHFRTPNFVHDYDRVAEKYSVDRSLIEIEVTESMVLEDSAQLINIVHNIKSAGFGCSMDDFGSGYSSLNLIQTIPVDVLKLDKIFFRAEGLEIQRTEAVVSNVVSMAKALSMDTVAEGVEERTQVEMLKRAGCDYVQGYVFARPMEISAFENLFFKKVID